MRSKLRKGEIAEALFVAKALSLGMNVSKPFGQNCRYDFMVEVMGKAVRVQVKSTWQWVVGSGQGVEKSRQEGGGRRQEAGDRGPSTRGNGGRSPSTSLRARRLPAPRLIRMTPEKEYVVRAGGTTTRGARRYRASEVDYIAAYVGPEDEWYVIPVSQIPSAFTIVLPGRYARYREAWDQLCPRGVLVGDIHAAAEEQFPVSRF